jgi:3-deoxy-D-manno-octulosonic-acid transferase
MTTKAFLLFIHLYNILFESVLFVAIPILRRAPFARKWNIEERNRGPAPARPVSGKKVVWIHAASLGEVKLLIRFLLTLHQKHPDQLYVLTATTAAGVDYLRAFTHEAVAGVGFLPFDTLRRMRRMVRAFGVSRIWIMETELWPAMIRLCMLENIPIGIVNGRMEEKSLASYRRFSRLFMPLFSSIDIVLAQSEIYAERFEQCSIARSKIHVTGNLKGCLTIRRPQTEERLRLRREMNIGRDHFVLTAGCIHPGEGAVLRRALDLLLENKFPVKCIAVPRHLDASLSICKELGAKTLLVKSPATSAAWDVCLVHSMGILESMYKIADAAFIGGTFVPVGGHNMWDAAQFAIPVFFGPDVHTQLESSRTLLAAGVAFETQTPQGLADAVLSVFRGRGAAFASSLDAFMRAFNASHFNLETVLP